MTSSQSLTGRTSVIVKVVAFLVLGFGIGLTVFVVLKKKGPLGRETGGVSSVAPTPKTIDQGANVPAQAAAQEKEFPATNGFGGFRSSGNGPSAAVVPSGASIKVKLNTTVGEDTEEGDTFVASLTEP